MSSIIASIKDLITSLFEVVFSIFGIAANLVQNGISLVASTFAGLINMVIDMFKGVINAAGGIVSFTASNFLILGVIAAAFFGFLQFQRSQGRTVKVGDKKLN
ncbi:hypothetical protein GQ43DRAFT_444108 [Delitschia confertaspora ATCC 74209]|uniref:Uncharacterized protein n=1 Tax=Delitschia confertaspora ATCC 74209 TaxID=1513339 RepID=A0A9P4MP51_9PLEO|nr:hypothetical protein GQ43DRAFT_444108 [Delitschia confertaspora ATCC 74209]